MCYYMHDNSPLRDIPFNEMTAKVIQEHAQQGDFIAREAFEITGRYLGIALADCVKITSPQVIYLLGGLAKAGKLIFEPTKRHFEESLLEIHKDKIQIEPSGLEGRNAAILGASALVWKEIEGLA